MIFFKNFVKSAKKYDNELIPFWLGYTGYVEISSEAKKPFKPGMLLHICYVKGRQRHTIHIQTELYETWYLHTPF